MLGAYAIAYLILQKVYYTYTYPLIWWIVGVLEADKFAEDPLLLSLFSYL